MTDSITWWDEEDPEMRGAIEAAQSSYGLFVAEMELESRRIVSGLHGAVVKGFFPCPDPLDGGEHMWIEVTGADDVGVVGTLASEPRFVTGIAEGQEVHLPRERISDWVVFFGLKQRLVKPPVRGGFTLAVIWGRLSAEERADCSTDPPISWFLDSGTAFGAT